MGSGPRIPTLVVAGAKSGVGKTSVTLGLVAALRRRGLDVRTFKVGPDFLDPTHLAMASARPCYNLDGWMMGRDYVESLFVRAAAGADLAVVEGVMGLFDGADVRSASGSTAEIARWLGAPVLFVLDAHGMAGSIAAMVKGYATLDPELKLAGVVANQCGSERHCALLAEALEAAGLPPLVGGIPRGGLPELASRHLGLVTADAKNMTAEVLSGLADGVERAVKLDALLALAREHAPAVRSSAAKDAGPAVRRRVRLGLAWDEAFHFYYQDTLDALEAAGCELLRFSPVRDARLPEALDGLYFGGGYPEVHAAELSANGSMLGEVRAFAASGRPVYAECGGLMYLSEGVQMLDGRRFSLAGVLPAGTRMLARRRALGHVEVALAEDSLWGARGALARGHEFHYSELTADPAAAGGWRRVYAPQPGTRGLTGGEGFAAGGVLASYVHLHLASRPELVANWAARCAARETA